MPLLAREDAVRIAPSLPTLVRAGFALTTFADPRAFGPYVRRACEAGRALGLYVREDGRPAADPKEAVAPEESARRLLARLEAAPALARAVDESFKSALPKETLAQIAIEVAYEMGHAVEIAMVAAPVEAGTPALAGGRQAVLPAPAGEDPFDGMRKDLDEFDF